MELRKAFRYRNSWIGLAMLWIIYFHAGFRTDSRLLSTIQAFGYGGVDFCVFASGIGCYYSLEKDPDALRFLKRRVNRLWPTYICFIVPWMLWKMTSVRLPLGAILGNLLGIQSLVTWDYHFNWYIGGLVVYYFLIPYFKQITDSCRSLWQDMAVVAVLLISSVPFWYDDALIIIFSRLPILYLGMFVAKKAKQGYSLGIKDAAFQLLLVLAGVVALWVFQNRFPDFLWSCGLYWYPFVLIVPGSCLLISFLAAWLEKFAWLKWMNRLLETVGAYSFEIYLVHVFLYEFFLPGRLERLYRIPHNLRWALTIPVIALGAFLLNRIAAIVDKAISKKRNGCGLP